MRDADARSDFGLSLQSVPEAKQDSFGVCGRAFGNDGELVTSHSSNCVMRSNGQAEALRAVAQDFVACCVTVGVVDLLKTIQVHGEHANIFSVSGSCTALSDQLALSFSQSATV